MNDNTNEKPKKVGRWKKGESGNPSGRPKSDNAGMRDKLRKAMPEIIDMLITKAKEGDMAATKLILDRVVPTLKPIGNTIQISGLIAGDRPEDQAKAITSAMASGLVDVATAGDMMSVVERQMKVVEVSELTARIEQLKLGLNSNGDD